MLSKLFKLSALLAVFTTAAHAQLYVVEGRETGAIAYFNFKIDPIQNKLIVEVDNTHYGDDWARGTITSFGFNIKDSLLSKTIKLESQYWTKLKWGRSEPSDWTFKKPYDINVGGNKYDQDVGVITGSNANGGSPHKGIKFGEKVTFVFKFYKDFNETDLKYFLGDNGVTARWQEVQGDDCIDSSDVGHGDEFFCGPLPPVPEPSTYAIFGALTLVGGVIVRRLRSRKAAQVKAA